MDSFDILWQHEIVSTMKPKNKTKIWENIKRNELSILAMEW